jgi:molybdate transport system substrate-binding protein
MSWRHWSKTLGIGLASALCALPASARPPETPAHPELLVFAASSLTDVLGELAPAWEKTSGVSIKLSFAASSVLARQIEGGARADLFVSADQEWMDYLAARHLIRTDMRRDLAGNSLALIAPADSQIAVKLTSSLQLAPLLAGGRLAIADPDTVPAGRYARAALTHLGLWDSVSTRLARAENVRAALIYVARGESPLGIVYSTDAQIDPKVRVLATFPDNTHPPITYPAAATVSAGPGSAAFLAFLGSAEAMQTWKKHGFREPRQ